MRLLLSLFLLAAPTLSAEPPDSTVTLLFGGDCMFAGSYAADVGLDAHRAFAALPELRDADLTSVNLEGPVTVRGKKVPKPFNFRMPPSVLGILTRAGIDHVCIANNHVFDYGPAGLFDTISYLDSVGIARSGAGRTEQEAYAPARFTLKGRRIGIFAFYGGGEAPAAIGSRPGVARREISRIQRTIRAVRDSIDYLVVILHWGAEMATVPERGQQAFARSVIDAGADAVIGHHPHVLQGIERYRNGVIVYSLGNFIFGGHSRSTYDTGLFEIRLDTGGSGRRVPGYRFIPVRVDRWQARALYGPEGEGVMRIMRERSASLRNSIFNSHGQKKESP